MKLYLDPEKNRVQFDRLKAFSNSRNMMLRKSFYLLLGFCLLVFGTYAAISSQELFKVSGSGFTQREYGVITILLGAVVLGACYLIPKLFRKIGEYEPRDNTGDEWEK